MSCFQKYFLLPSVCFFKFVATLQTFFVDFRWTDQPSSGPSPKIWGEDMYRTHCRKLSFVHAFVRYCKIFHKCIFLTRSISLAADSACSAFPLAAQRLHAPRTTACNNFAFSGIFFMYHLSVVFCLRPIQMQVNLESLLPSSTEVLNICYNCMLIYLQFPTFPY